MALNTVMPSTTKKVVPTSETAGESNANDALQAKLLTIVENKGFNILMTTVLVGRSMLCNCFIIMLS